MAIEGPLWWHVHEVRRLSPQSPGGRECLCVFFFCLVCLCCYVFPPPALHNIYFIHLCYDIAYCTENAVKHQQNKQANRSWKLLLEWYWCEMWIMMMQILAEFDLDIWFVQWYWLSWNFVYTLEHFYVQLNQILPTAYRSMLQGFDGIVQLLCKMCLQNALTLLVGWQECRPACKNWVLVYVDGSDLTGALQILGRIARA